MPAACQSPHRLAEEGAGIWRVKRTAILLVACLAYGCATVGSYQTECEKRHRAFPDVVVCLKAAVAEDPRWWMSSNASVKLYLLKAEQLSERVQRGEMSDLDARVAVQALYVDLQRGREVGGDK